MREALRADRREVVRLHLRERSRPEVAELAEAARAAGIPVSTVDADALFRAQETPPAVGDRTIDASALFAEQGS